MTQQISRRSKTLKGVLPGGDSYEFRHVTPEFFQGVPTQYATTPEERIALFGQLTEQLEELATNPAAAVTDVLAVQMPWRVLSREPGYNRRNPIYIDRVANLVANWASEKFQAIRVTARPVYDEYQRMIDVVFAVTDGWHRRTALIEMLFGNGQTDFNILAVLSGVIDVAGSARSFEGQNSVGPNGSKPVGPIETWRAEVMARNPEALEICSLFATYGFDATCADFGTGWPHVNFGATIRKLMHNPVIGREVIERVLSLYADQTLIGLHGHKTALTAGFFGGLCMVVAHYERPGFVHDVGLRYMLSQPSFIAEVAAALKKRAALELNEVLMPQRTLRGRDEDLRYTKHAAAMLLQYQLYVPPPRARSATWVECPSELRKLWYEARHIQDFAERTQTVAKIHRKLVEREMAPHWVVTADKPFTR